MKSSLIALLLSAAATSSVIGDTPVKVVIAIEIDHSLLSTTALETHGENADTVHLVPCKDAFVHLQLPPKSRAFRDRGVDDWIDRVSQPAAPRKHSLEVRNNYYIPRVLVIRAGDSIVDPEFGNRQGLELHNGIWFKNVQKNPAFGGMLREYQFTRWQVAPIEIRNRTHRERCSYLFVVSHPCNGVSDKNGQVHLKDMPRNVAIPLHVQIPWLKTSECQFTSPDVEVSEDGRFSLPPSEQDTRHVRIQILPPK